jgi:hypothetical protein
LKPRKKVQFWWPFHFPSGWDPFIVIKTVHLKTGPSKNWNQKVYGFIKLSGSLGSDIQMATILGSKK